MERNFHPRPTGVDTGDLISFDRIGERPRADTKNIATVIDEMAGSLDRGIGARKPRDAVRSILPILDVPRHSATRWIKLLESTTE